MGVPLNTPICLKAHTGNNLQNEFMTRKGRCNNRNTQAWEQLILIQTEDDKIIIQSRWNGRNLQVQPSGSCVFANHNQLLSEKFDVETDEHGKVYFISCQTGNVVQCDENGYAKCVNKNRLEWGAWSVIFPSSATIVTSAQVKVIASTASGAILLPGLGLAAAALVPTAMSTFGTVVAGVGTFHAPLAAGGCAAFLQASSAVLISGSAAAVGAVAGASVGASVFLLRYSFWSRQKEIKKL